MAYEFKMMRKVEFAETDMAGIVHFSNFFKFMESTEHAFFRSLGFSVALRRGGKRIGWPRVRASCEYRFPLRFEDVVEIHLLVREKKSKSISYSFFFRKKERGKQVVVAHGTMTSVCVILGQSSNRMKAVRIPQDIANNIQVAPRKLLSQES